MGPTGRGSPATDASVLRLKQDAFVKQGHIGAPPVPYRHTGCYQKHSELPGAVSPTERDTELMIGADHAVSCWDRTQSMTPPSVCSWVLCADLKQKMVTYHSRKGTSKFNKGIIYFLII